MLLRVVAAAGASAVLGAAACGGKTSGPDPQFHGSIVYPDAGEEAGPCSEGCGVVDAWSPGLVDGGVMQYPEGGDETTVCNGFCVNPEAASEGGGDAGTD